MAYLRHLFNGTTVTMYELKEKVSLGRSMNCQIPIEDPTVSSEHAILQPSEEGWSLTDAGSTNGILVKGKPVRSVLLVSGTIFEIGTHEFEFLCELPNDLDKTLKIKKSWIPGVYYTE